jgi:hypothetical protein
MGEYLFISKNFFFFFVFLKNCLVFFTIILLLYLLKEWGYYKNIKKKVIFLLYFGSLGLLYYFLNVEGLYCKRLIVLRAFFYIFFKKNKVNSVVECEGMGESLTIHINNACDCINN